MSGILALYFSVLQTSPQEFPQSSPSTSAALIPPHFQPAAAWKWFYFILRPPFISLEPTPLLLVTVLEIAAENLMEVYGRQFAKVLEVLLREGIREGKAGFSTKSRSTLVRLELWLEDWEKSQTVEGVKGRRCDP